MLSVLCRGEMACSCVDINWIRDFGVVEVVAVVGASGEASSAAASGAAEWW